MELYRDFSCIKIAEDYYLVFDESEKPHIEVGGFTHDEMFIYPKYKNLSYGYLIRQFMNDVKSGKLLL